MRDVVIIGIGQTPVEEHWGRSLRHLAHDAIMAAMRDADIETADALYVGNMLSGELERAGTPGRARSPTSSACAASRR